MAKKANNLRDHRDAVQRITSLRLQDQRDRAEETAGGSDGRASLEEYHFFDADSIREGLRLTEAQYRDGKRVMDSGQMGEMNISFGRDLIRIDSGRKKPSDEDGWQARFVQYSQGRNWAVEMFFNRYEMIYSQCSCWECMLRRKYQKNSVGHVLSGHEMAAYLNADYYMRSNAVGDITTGNATRLLEEYKSGLPAVIGNAAPGGKEILTIKPKVTVDEMDNLWVQFHVGSRRLYKVKDIDELLSDVKRHRTRRCGKNAEFRFSPEGFDESGKRWLGFMDRAAKMLKDFSMGTDPYADPFSDKPFGVGSEIPLISTILDDFHSVAGEEKDPIELRFKAGYHDMRGHGNDRMKLTAVEGGSVRPGLSIEPIFSTDGKAFDGVCLHGELPKLLRGVSHYYYLSIGEDEAALCRISREEAEKLEPLMSAATVDGEIEMYIGRSSLADFYRKALPQLSEVTDIAEVRPELIRQYIPVKPELVCYLDLDEEAVICAPAAFYGEISHSPFDCDGWRSFRLEPEYYRDTESETDLMEYLESCMPEKDTTEKIFLMPRDEETLYDFLDHGLTSLMNRCEVRATEQFMRLKIRRRMPMHAGISMADGLLSVELTSDELSPDELLAAVSGYRKAKKFIRLKNGDFLRLEENEELQKLAEMMDTLQVTPKQLLSGKMHIPAFRALYLDKMMESMEDVYANRDSHFKKLIKEFKTISDADYDVPSALKNVLRKYQAVGYRWMRMLDEYGFGGILADDMGLGKTLQATALLLADHDEYVAGEKPQTSLIVCPASLVYNWEEEIHRFASPLSVQVVAGSKDERRLMIAGYENYDVLVTSYDLLKRDIAEYENCRFHYEIIDEAQYIKNQRTEAAKSVKLIKAKTRFALTGTPIENRLSELWSIFDYAMPSFLYDYGTFLGEFEAPIVRNTDEERMERLRRMVAPFILRRTKEEVLKDLPEKLEEVHYAGFGTNSEQRKLYDAQVVKMRDDLRGKTEEELRHSRIEILAELTRIRQICCDPALLYDNYHGDSVKKETCMELVRSVVSGEHKALIFSQFVQMLELLKVELDKEQIPYYEITGATPKEERLSRVKEFNSDDTPVFLISLKAGGTGLNLTGADVVIHYDPWWNMAVQNQATDRAHRIGQTKVVTVYKLILKGTIEERIMEMQEIKKTLAEDVLSAENIAATAFSREELLDLLEAEAAEVINNSERKKLAGKNSGQKALEQKGRNQKALEQKGQDQKALEQKGQDQKALEQKDQDQKRLPKK